MGYLWYLMSELLLKNLGYRNRVCNCNLRYSLEEGKAKLGEITFTGELTVKLGNPIVSP